MPSEPFKVSIIVPIYNVEKYLDECLKSLVNQTLKDIEIICINDGSTDNSRNILEKYLKEDERIKVIDKENSGYGDSMNIGLNNAKGEYIGIVEPDDFIDLKMFEDLYELAVKNEADIVKSDFYYYTTQNKRIRKAGKIAKNKTKKVFSAKDDPSILKIMPSIWSCVYKNEFLKENNINFLETKGASFQDTSFFFKTMASAKRIVFTQKSYLYYRTDNENSSVKKKDKVFCICDEYREITKFLDENPKIKNIVNSIKLSTQFNAYKWNALRIDEAFRDDFIDEFQKEFKKYFENNEIKKDFYKKVKVKELKMLLDNKKAFRSYINKLSEKKTKKEKRRKLFSIRINSARISIVLFGKQILEIG